MKLVTATFYKFSLPYTAKNIYQIFFYIFIFKHNVVENAKKKKKNKIKSLNFLR